MIRPDMKIYRLHSRWRISLVLIALLLGIFVISAATAEGATGTQITLSAPSRVSVGDLIEIRANLQDTTGTPISGATLQFLSPASFLAGSTGLMEVGEATTDDEGVAILEYEPRRNGTISIMAVFDGESGYARSERSIIFVVEGDRQLHESDAGITVPFINKSLLAGIVGGIWAVLVFVGFLIARIALAKRE